jgi:hypothetical protein
VDRNVGHLSEGDRPKLAQARQWRTSIKMNKRQDKARPDMEYRTPAAGPTFPTVSGDAAVHDRFPVTTRTGARLLAGLLQTTLEAANPAGGLGWQIEL